MLASSSTIRMLGTLCPPPPRPPPPPPPPPDASAPFNVPRMLASSSTIRMLGTLCPPLQRPPFQRQPHDEIGAAAGHARDLDAPPVVRDDALDDRQPEPAAVRLGGEAGHERG